MRTLLANVLQKNIFRTLHINNLKSLRLGSNISQLGFLPVNTDTNDIRVTAYWLPLDKLLVKG